MSCIITHSGNVSSPLRLEVPHLSPRLAASALSALLDEVDEPEASLVNPDEPLVRDVQLRQDNEGEQGERHEGVVQPAAGLEESLANRLRPLRHLLVGLGGHEPCDG